MELVAEIRFEPPVDRKDRAGIEIVKCLSLL